MTRQRCSDTWRKAERRRFTGELIGSSRRVEGKYGGVTGVASSSPTARIFTGLCLSDGHGAQITASNDQRQQATSDEQGVESGSSVVKHLLYHGEVQIGRAHV